jgi:hypothetical protein
MAYKFTIDNISPDGNGHVAYVKLIDESKPDDVLANVCVHYAGDDSAFTAALEAKMQAAITKIEAKKTATDAITSLINAVDTSKIKTAAVESLSSKEIKQ